jgi:hypothetical protein
MGEREQGKERWGWPACRGGSQATGAVPCSGLGTASSPPVLPALVWHPGQVGGRRWESARQRGSAWEARAGERPAPEAPEGRLRSHEVQRDEAAGHNRPAENGPQHPRVHVVLARVVRHKKYLCSVLQLRHAPDVREKLRTQTSVSVGWRASALRAKRSSRRRVPASALRRVRTQAAVTRGHLPCTHARVPSTRSLPVPDLLEPNSGVCTSLSSRSISSSVVSSRSVSSSEFAASASAGDGAGAGAGAGVGSCVEAASGPARASAQQWSR